MRLWRALLVVLVILATGWVTTGMAAAKTLSVSGKIRLSGTVAPAHYVIVNKSGIITKIISNTYQDTVLLIYKNKLDSQTRQPLTNAVYKQYQKIVPAGSSHPGVLYQISTQPPPVKSKPLSVTTVAPAKTVPTFLSVSLDLSAFNHLPTLA